jgi:flagellar assembly factor FliW
MKKTNNTQVFDTHNDLPLADHVLDPRALWETNSPLAQPHEQKSHPKDGMIFPGSVDGAKEGQKRRRMEINHRHLGVISCNDDDSVTFPQGLLGFLKLKKYIFLEHEELAPFLWMVSVDNPDIFFPLVDPMLFCPDYSPNITKRDLNELSAENPQSLQMYSIVTIQQDAHLATANLSAPILINRQQKIGKQLVLLDDRYSTKHRILNS